MHETRLIGVHLGTSTVRVAVYDADGNRIEGGDANVDEQTAIAWERALREATPELPDQGLCSVASTSGTALLVDEFGEPVFSPLMYYESAPDSAHVERVAELHEIEGLADRGISLSATSPLSKILALRAENRDRFENVEWILSPTTWLLYRLRYGNSTKWRSVETDWTNALKFGADITPALPEWFDSLFEVIDLERSLLPDIRPPGTFVGTAESEFADRLGYDRIKLYQGLTDGSASVLANGCLEPGDFSITSGAASVIKYVSESIVPHEALYYHRHPLEGYLPGAAIDSAVVFRWFCDRILDCSPERGLELAQATPLGQEYEVFLQGNRSPFFDPAVGASILGLRHDTDLSGEEVKGRLTRGIATSIALAEGTYISLIEDHFDTDVERVPLMNDDLSGDSVEFGWWNELRSAIWGRPVVQMEPRTTVGMVIPAALLTSVYADIDEASERLLRVENTLEPDPEVTKMYETQRQSYLERWRTLADLY